MATKRSRSPELVPNPFIKKRNLEWSIDITGLPHDAASSSSSDDDKEPSQRQDEEQPNTSAVEAGEVSVDDHLNYFSTRLQETALSPFTSGTPHLPVEDYRKLYEVNAGSSQGAHFIIHQHDHPIAGTHYDLRLQINETSSASWAIMYGLPGDPNSFRLNRNATETRIHCLWNHLIETGSHATGSLLIWDTGTYTVLPTERKQSQDDSQSTDEESESQQMTEQQKLHQAFAARKTRIQLHGTRLPTPYVLYLRLTREEDAAGRARNSRVPKTKRRRGAPSALSSRTTRSAKGKNAPEYATSSDSKPGSSSTLSRKGAGEKQEGTGTGNDEDDAEIVHVPAEQVDEGEKGISATERELRELEDEEVRRTNAYPGATNTIGSVHQRRWYLSLDREASGFVKRRREGRIVWESADSDSSLPIDPLQKREDGKGKGRDEDKTAVSRLTYPFYVRGVEHERSVVTGRLGSEVLRDEGVTGYVGRKGWLAILK
ncbi:DNA polymerase ligase-domain-containing protein [Xylaria sp. FL0043]|nr:DNA polymerase ligase-domain-containing protein [Xylaria sp. FL0043]